MRGNHPYSGIAYSKTFWISCSRRVNSPHSLEAFIVTRIIDLVSKSGVQQPICRRVTHEQTTIGNVPYKSRRIIMVEGSKQHQTRILVIRTSKCSIVIKGNVINPVYLPD